MPTIPIVVCESGGAPAAAQPISRTRGGGWPARSSGYARAAPFRRRRLLADSPFAQLNVLGFKTGLGAIAIWIGLSIGKIVYAALLLRLQLLANRPGFAGVYKASNRALNQE